MLLFILAGLCCRKKTAEVEVEQEEVSINEVEETDTQSEKSACCACLPCFPKKSQEDQLEMTETTQEEPVRNQPTQQTGIFSPDD